MTLSATGFFAGALLAASAARGGELPHSAVAIAPSGREFTLEIAADSASRQRGYMGRASVGPKEGMLFIFDDDVREAFWMKNCKVALDIIWLDRSFRIVWIAADRKPCPAEGECPSVEPPAPARYVLEVAGGTAAAEHWASGDTFVILSEPPLR